MFKFLAFNLISVYSVNLYTNVCVYKTIVYDFPNRDDTHKSLKLMV